jgi:dTDP-4-dehydrorhamnose 3,5-epimerase-like enzyme
MKTHQTPIAELICLHTAVYTPSAEGGICPTDPRLLITRRLAPQDLSDRDRIPPLLTSDFTGLVV